MPAIKYLPVSWNEYHKLAQSLAAKILSQKEKPEQIVAIARGGLTLGHLLSDLLQIPISAITIQSYTDIQTQGELKITARLQVSVRGKHILLVDDVADTGKTLKRAMSYLKKSHPIHITAVTMFYKPHSVFKPDIYIQETSKWILFPYEPTEMIHLITMSLQKGGESKENVRKFLKALRYTTDQIIFTEKHYPT